MSSLDTIVKILDLARWAPSGDNMQTWQFEIQDATHVTVYCRDTRDHCVYDLDGHPSQISFGALLETMAIAASAHGLRTEVQRRGDEASPIFDVRLCGDAAVLRSPLIDSIKRRSVQRRPYLTRPLRAEEKLRLEQAVGANYRIQWLESASDKRKAALVMFRNARLRLTMPEAFDVHRSIIDWDARHSNDKVPDQALGVDAMTIKLMRWAMRSWQRMRKVNALMGTWAPRLQMDLIPGLACGAHYVLKSRRPPQSIDDYVDAGRAVQRFWLTATALDLQMQPEMTPLIFRAYLRQGLSFTAVPAIAIEAQQLQPAISKLIETDELTPVYMGRIGQGTPPRARSLRMSLGELLR